MPKIFTPPILSKYPDRQCSRLGYFELLPIELLVMIFKYTIEKLQFKEIFYIMNTCQTFRSVIRDFLSLDIQNKFPSELCLHDYQMIYGFIPILLKSLSLTSDLDVILDFSLSSTIESLQLTNVKCHGTVKYPINLTTLKLYHCVITDHVLDHILANNPCLNFVSIDYCHPICWHNISCLVSKYPNVVIYHNIRFAFADEPEDHQNILGMRYTGDIWGPSLWRMLYNVNQEPISPTKVKKYYPKQRKMRYQKHFKN